MNFLRRIVRPQSNADEDFYYELKELLNFKPIHLAYYKKAFIHRSMKMVDEKGNPLNYERLEFLGDAILSSVVSSYLYKQVPEGNEGYLTQMRSKIVSREHLNELGRDLNLIQFIESKANPLHFGENIHGNIFEAFSNLVDLSDRAEWVGGSSLVPHILFAKLGVAARG